MSSRHFRFTARCVALAATLSAALAASPASAAWLNVATMGHEHYMCATYTLTRHGQSTATSAQAVAGGHPAHFYLGTLPAAPDHDSPDFASITLRCWLRSFVNVGAQPKLGEPSYSIELRRDDPFWALTAPDAADPRPELPRDGMTLGMTITADENAIPPAHIDVLRAWIQPFSGGIGSAGETCADYVLSGVHYRLTRD